MVGWGGWSRQVPPLSPRRAARKGISYGFLGSRVEPRAKCSRGQFLPSSPPQLIPRPSRCFLGAPEAAFGAIRGSLNNRKDEALTVLSPCPGLQHLHARSRPWHFTYSSSRGACRLVACLLSSHGISVFPPALPHTYY